MARDYGRIRSQFWNDEKVKSWPLDVRAVAAYLMTCEHATALGAFRLPAAYMSDDLDMSPSQARAYLDQLAGLGWIKVCQKTGWIWIVNYLRHNRPENVNVWKHVRGLAKTIPVGVPFRDAVLESIERRQSEPKEAVSDDENNPIETVSEPIERVSNNNTEPNLTQPNRTEPEPIVPEASASAPSIAPIADQIWKAGVPYLGSAGVSPEKARAMLGKWRKEHGDAETLAALIAAQNQGISEPIPWIQARFKNGGSPRQSAQSRGSAQRDTFLAAALASCGHESSGTALWDDDLGEGLADQRGPIQPARVA